MRLNYRMHDKYLIIDESMYLLGGRNTNDIFLGDKKTRINVDRDIFVYEETQGKGESLQALEKYFDIIWNEAQVRKKKKTYAASCEEKRIPSVEITIPFIKREVSGYRKL